MAAISALYARAFVDVIFARKSNANDAVGSLEEFRSLLRENAELRNVLENPSVPKPQKLSLLDALLMRVGVDRPVRNFLAVLMDKHRMRLLEEIIVQVKAEVNTRLGFVEAAVTSARELSAEERTALEAQLGKATGSKIRAQYAKDATLLGGAMAKVGSTVYDGSVRGRLERLKHEIAGN